MPTRRALVIGGGGAKGAYAFGCLEAFAQKGIHFDAVAGTSVGALNAALWSCGALDRGRKLWSELSFANTLPCRFPWPFSWRPLALSLGFVIVPLNLLWAAIHSRPIPYKPWVVGLLALINTGLIELWINLINPATPVGLRLMALGLGLAPVLNLALGMGWVTRVRFFALAFWAGVVPPLSMLQSSFSFLFQTLVLIPIWIGVLAIVWIADAALSRIFASAVVLDASPLLATVEALLIAHPLNCPTHVTLAAEKELWDPDDCPHIMDEAIPGYGLTIPQRHWLPSYVSLNSLPSQTAARACAASAALPFGIVASVKIDNGSYVDGGMVDNVPIFPFVNSDSIDEVFVIILRHYKSDKKAIEREDLTPDEWSRKKRLLALTQVPLPPDSLPSDKLVHHSPPVIVPLETPARFPGLTLFYPKEPLGGLIRGTLNFRSSYALDLMNRGYEDTVTRLHAKGICDRSSPTSPALPE